VATYREYVRSQVSRTTTREHKRQTEGLAFFIIPTNIRVKIKNAIG
jgi:hypothetical protein